MRRVGRWAAGTAVVGLLLGASFARASPALAPGDRVPNPELAALDGGRARLLDGRGVEVVVFLSTKAFHAAAALDKIARLQAEEGAPAARYVAVFPASEPRGAIRALVEASGAKMTVVLDERDRLAADFGIFSVPLAAVVTPRGRLVAAEHHTTLGWADWIAARIAEGGGTPKSAAR